MRRLGKRDTGCGPSVRCTQAEQQRFGFPDDGPKVGLDRLRLEKRRGPLERGLVEHRKLRTKPRGARQEGQHRGRREGRRRLRRLRPCGMILAAQQSCRDRALKRSKQGCLRERLGQVAIHACLAAFVNLLVKRLRGQGQNGNLPARAGKRPDAAGRRQSVHAGHAQVHQNHVEVLGRDGRDRLRPALGAGCFVAGRTDE